jgi:hypothetical protein
MTPILLYFIFSKHVTRHTVKGTHNINIVDREGQIFTLAIAEIHRLRPKSLAFTGHPLYVKFLLVEFDV